MRVTGNGEEGVRVDASDGAIGLLSVERSTLSGNTSGVVNIGSAGDTIVVSRSVIAGNAGFGLQQLGGVLASRANNAIHDNNAGGAQTAETITLLASL